VTLYKQIQQSVTPDACCALDAFFAAAAAAEEGAERVSLREEEGRLDLDFLVLVLPSAGESEVGVVVSLTLPSARIWRKAFVLREIKTIYQSVKLC
jgi:7,8-dihydro-6-hydroxymethylpterin-pyrophosphokinase